MQQFCSPYQAPGPPVAFGNNWTGPCHPPPAFRTPRGARDAPHVFPFGTFGNSSPFRPQYHGPGDADNNTNPGQAFGRHIRVDNDVSPEADLEGHYHPQEVTSVTVPGTPHQHLRRLEKPWFVLLPSSPLMALWELSNVLVLAWLLTAMPFTFAFVDTKADREYLALDIFVSMHLILDTVFRMFVFAFVRVTGDDNHPELLVETRPLRILREYLRSPFLVFCDFVSAVPWTLMNPSLRVFDLPKTARLFLKFMVVARAFRFVGGLFSLTHRTKSRSCRLASDFALRHRIATSPVVRLIRMSLSLVILVHVLACLCTLAVVLSGFWLGRRHGSVSDAHGWAYMQGAIAESLVQNGTVWQQYLVSVYWVVTTLTTVGYGDITPKGEPEIAFAIAVMAIGTVSFAALIGTVSEIAQNRRAQQKHEKLRIDRLMQHVITTATVSGHSDASSATNPRFYY